MNSELCISAEEEEGFPPWWARDPAVPLHDVARPRRPLAHPPRTQGRDSIEINIGPKVGPRCKIEKDICMNYLEAYTPQIVYKVAIRPRGNLPYIQITSIVLPYIRLSYKRSVVYAGEGFTQPSTKI